MTTHQRQSREIAFGSSSLADPAALDAYMKISQLMTKRMLPNLIILHNS